MFLIFSGCISVPLLGGNHRVDPRDLFKITTALSLEEKIRAALRAAKQRLTDGAKRLHAAECGTRTCYSAQEVSKLVDAARADLSKGIPKDAEALRVAVEDEIDAEMARLQPRADGAIHLVRLQPVAADGYDAASVNDAISRIVAAIDRILSYNKLALPLDVITVPTSAHFEMQIQANQRKLPAITTNERVPNVWRGIYTATVSKAGYKSTSRTIDLINGSPTRVTCTLQPSGDRDDTVCHVE